MSDQMNITQDGILNHPFCGPGIWPPMPYFYITSLLSPHRQRLGLLLHNVPLEIEYSRNRNKTFFWQEKVDQAGLKN